MSPVCSSSAVDFSIRRRPVSPTATRLFRETAEQSTLPYYPDETSPNDRTSGLAPAETGPSGSEAGHTTADCPLPSSAVPGSPNQAHGWARDSAAPLVGIARLAASSKPAETHRNSQESPEYFLLPVKSILNSCDSKRVPFEWTINPYRGCEFGCKYCYARYTHEYMELDGSEFEKKIFVKKDAAPLLSWDVAQKYSYASKSSGGTEPEHIAIGTATDPYQPAEREYGVTRACLEELAKRDGLSISITTKSHRVVRDIDVLKEIASRSMLSINMTVTTMRIKLARLLEPRAPRPDLRMAAVKELREAGLAAGVFASPLLPGITDCEGDLEAVAAAAQEAGAQWFVSGVLFLMPSSAKQFLPFVREKFPRLAEQYQQWYAKNGYAPEEYRKKIANRVASLRQKHGFSSRPWDERKRPTPCAQLSLTWNAAVSAAPGANDSGSDSGRIQSCAAG